MPRYIKIAQVEAHPVDLCDVAGLPDEFRLAICRCTRGAIDGGAHVHTLEGPFPVRTGDYMIRGVAGEFYACNPEIFSRSYALAPVQE